VGGESEVIPPIFASNHKSKTISFWSIALAPTKRVLSSKEGRDTYENFSDMLRSYLVYAFLWGTSRYDWSYSGVALGWL